MAVKYFDKIKKAWLPFPGTVGEKGDTGADGVDGKDGKGAYQIAKENGYTGSEEEFNEALGNIGQIPDIEIPEVNLPDIDAMPTAGSKNLVESGGVYKAIQDIKTDIESGSGGDTIINGLTKEEADGLYEPILNVDKTLFYVKNANSSSKIDVKYLGTLEMPEGAEIVVDAAKPYTFFAYTYTNDDNAPSIKGGSVRTVDGKVTAYAPANWYTDPANFIDKEFVWMSVGTFIVDGDQVGDWSTPVRYSVGGIAGADGSSVEFIYARVSEKTTTYPSGLKLPDNSWGYQSEKGQNEHPWTNEPMGVGREYKTEFTSVRVKETGAENWGKWSTPVV